MTRIEVPSETLLVEIGKDGLNIVETFIKMSEVDESAHVKCDICSIPLGRMKDVKHMEFPESITIAVKNGFKPDQMLKYIENTLEGQIEKITNDFMDIILESWKSLVDKSETPWALCSDCYQSIQVYIKEPGC